MVVRRLAPRLFETPARTQTFVVAQDRVLLGRWLEGPFKGRITGLLGRTASTDEPLEAAAVRTARELVGLELSRHLFSRRAHFTFTVENGECDEQGFPTLSGKGYDETQLVYRGDLHDGHVYLPEAVTATATFEPRWYPLSELPFAEMEMPADNMYKQPSYFYEQVLDPKKQKRLTGSFHFSTWRRDGCIGEELLTHSSLTVLAPTAALPCCASSAFPAEPTLFHDPCCSKSHTLLAELKAHSESREEDVDTVYTLKDDDKEGKELELTLLPGGSGARDHFLTEDAVDVGGSGSFVAKGALSALGLRWCTVFRRWRAEGGSVDRLLSACGMADRTRFACGESQSSDVDYWHNGQKKKWPSKDGGRMVKVALSDFKPPSQIRQRQLSARGEGGSVVRLLNACGDSFRVRNIRESPLTLTEMEVLQARLGCSARELSRDDDIAEDDDEVAVLAAVAADPKSMQRPIVVWGDRAAFGQPTDEEEEEEKEVEEAASLSVASLKVAELRAELETRGLDTLGLKKDLAARLLDNCWTAAERVLQLESPYSGNHKDRMCELCGKRLVRVRSRKGGAKNRRGDKKPKYHKKCYNIQRLTGAFDL